MSHLKSITAIFACVGMVLPHSAGVAAPRTTEAIDVALGPGHVLQGKLLTPEGTAISGETVEFTRRDQRVIETITGPDGSFSVSNVTAGVYLASFVKNHRLCRVWAPRTSPPSAIREVLFVPEQQVVRGQPPSVGTYYLIILGVTGAAIAVRRDQSTDAS